MNALLREFSEGHQVLYLVAQKLHGRKLEPNSQHLSVTNRHKDAVVMLANRAIQEGLLVQFFQSQSGSPAGLVDSLDLTDAGRKVLGLPVLVRDRATRELSLF